MKVSGLAMWLVDLRQTVFIMYYISSQKTTVFIRIEARALISYKRLLTRHLYEPYPHFIYVGVYLLYNAEPLRLFGSRHLYEPCFYSDKYGTKVDATYHQTSRDVPRF